MSGAAGLALDPYKGITDPGAEATTGGCARWPDELRLRSTLGELVRGRCHATNLCDYCARCYARENAELLALDAVNGVAPRVWAVLTTPSADPRPATFYRSRDQLVKALRRRWPGLEWSALVEFTTGYGTHAGGERRPHWNLLLKGVGPESLDQVRDVIGAVWCPRVGGNLRGQYVGEVSEVGGLMRYIALHFQKQSQAPPPGWRGHRFLKSRGYLWTDTEAARGQARAVLTLRRELWKAEQRGLSGAEALAEAERAVYELSELAWELVRLQNVPTSFDADGMPVSWGVQEC